MEYWQKITPQPVTLEEGEEGEDTFRKLQTLGSSEIKKKFILCKALN